MVLIRNIDKKDFYTNFYKSLNFILNLSNKELTILSLFSNMRASLPKELESSQLDAMTFSSVNRKYIAETLDISIFNLNNYINSLKTKKILTSNNKRLSINSNLWINVNEVNSPFSIEFKFNLV